MHNIKFHLFFEVLKWSISIILYIFQAFIFDVFGWYSHWPFCTFIQLQILSINHWPLHVYVVLLSSSLSPSFHLYWPVIWFFPYIHTPGRAGLIMLIISDQLPLAGIRDLCLPLSTMQLASKKDVKCNVYSSNRWVKWKKILQEKWQW